MTLEFQSDLLKYLVQFKQARTYISYLDPDLFDLDENHAVFSMLKAFVSKYNANPSLGEFLEFFAREAERKKNAITKEVYDIIEAAIREAFQPFTGNGDYIRDIIIEKYQLKMMASVFTENASKLKSGDSETIKKIFSQVNKINTLSDIDNDAESNRGEFLLADHKVGDYSVVEGNPTYLKSLNRMTSSGGFFAPQLIVLMGGPKSFKTGTLINIAINYVRDGFKVYYADCENGQDRIRDRARQCMLECSHAELTGGKFDSELAQIVDKFKVMGGEFRADFFPAKTKSMAEVEAELRFLEEEYNWKPDIICYDYLDLFKPEDYRVKEKRLQIQEVYFDAIRLQKRRGIFGITLSQVSRNAVNKKVISIQDFSEDFGKAANCHAAFAICATDEEKDAGVRRIVPVAQRDGVAQHSNQACFIEMKESVMTVSELKMSEWKKKIEDSKKPKDKKKTKRPIRRGSKIPVKDE